MIGGAVEDADLAREVGLVEPPAGIVCIGCADEPEPIRVEPVLGLHGQPALVGVAYVAAFGLAKRPTPGPVGGDLEPGPLVLRRQKRMRLGRTLDLRDFDDGFVAHPHSRVVPGQRTAVEHRGLEHATVGLVRVVRDREHPQALPPLFVHPMPQILRVGRVDQAERALRHVGVREDHVAMQVAPDPGRVFVGDEGGQPAGLVVTLGGIDDALPSTLERRFVMVGLRERVVLTVKATSLAEGHVAGERLRAVHFRQGVLGIGSGVHDPEEKTRDPSRRRSRGAGRVESGSRWDGRWPRPWRSDRHRRGTCGHRSPRRRWTAVYGRAGRRTAPGVRRVHRQRRL